MPKATPPPANALEGLQAASLDTLAQSWTRRYFEHTKDRELLEAQRSEHERKVLSRTGLKKYAQAQAYHLATTREAGSMTQAYWNSYHCMNTVSWWSDGGVTTDYCKQRWCPICARIYTADKINKYGDLLASWPDKHFVTLTIPNVPAGTLWDAINHMNSEFAKLRDKLKRRYKRGLESFQLSGLRKLEVTYNWRRDDYHPHYHLVVETKEMADWILREWLQRMPDARRIAQDVRPCDENTEKELFKYFTKIMSHLPDDWRLREAVRPLNHIFYAARRKPMFTTFGNARTQSSGLLKAELLAEVGTNCAHNDAKELPARHLVRQLTWSRELSTWAEGGNEYDLEREAYHG